MQALLRRMADAGVECAVVETTSSGLALHRVWGVAYDLAVVTNITSEHLEVHGTLEAYRRAKAMLFEAVDPDAPRQARCRSARREACVLNADDSSYSTCKRVLPRAHRELWRSRRRRTCAPRTSSCAPMARGSACVCRMGSAFEVETPLVARYNVSNCLAAITVGYLHGIAPEIMARALATFPGVPGRMERIEAGQPLWWWWTTRTPRTAWRRC